MLDFAMSATALFPLDAEVDLNTGDLNLTWTPSTGAESASIRLSLIKKKDATHAPNYFFGSETASDGAAYAFTVVLL